jgi:hypothetical protein
MNLPIQINPTFYYYHLFTAHYPYVFDTSGHYHRSLRDDMTTLRASFIYTEKVLLRLIDDIRKSRQGNPRPYAILLFSDHGPHGLAGAPYNLGRDTAQLIMHVARLLRFILPGNFPIVFGKPFSKLLTIRI